MFGHTSVSFESTFDHACFSFGIPFEIALLRTVLCFELYFVRLHRRRKVPYANLVYTYINRYTPSNSYLDFEYMVSCYIFKIQLPQPPRTTPSSKDANPTNPRNKYRHSKNRWLDRCSVQHATIQLRRPICVGNPSLGKQGVSQLWLQGVSPFLFLPSS